jgi:hypothetical protein
MLSWLFGKLRRPTPAVVKTDAGILMRQFGNEAESLARKRATGAGPQQHARHWPARGKGNRLAWPEPESQNRVCVEWG